LWVDFGLVAVVLALLVSIWFGLIASTAVAGPMAFVPSVGAWLAIILLGWAGGMAVAAIAVAAPLAHRRFPRRDVLWALVPATLLLLVPWGFLLSMGRPLLAWPRHRNVTLAWFAAIAVGLVVSIRVGAMNAAWILLAASGLLLYPTVFPYGAPSAMAPVWAALLLYLVIEDLRRRRSLAPEPDHNPRYALLIPVVLLILPFGLVFATLEYKFDSWYVFYVRKWLWGHAAEDTLPIRSTRWPSSCRSWPN
jgi:hypothetical protein